jgi:hypothetical protein
MKCLESVMAAFKWLSPEFESEEERKLLMQWATRLAR